MNNTEANPTLKLPRVLKKLLMKFGIQVPGQLQMLTVTQQEL